MSILNVSRRSVLAGLGAFVIGVGLPTGAAAETHADGEHELNAFVGVATDGTITVYIPSAEMGQGASTGLAQIVADEMDADWSKVRVAHGDEAKAYRFVMIPFHPMQVTGGSQSVRVWRTPMRQAGAAARATLVKAAARRWGVKVADCTVANSVVRNGDQQATFGELAGDAALLRPPKKPPLKDPAAFTLMGTSTPREDLLGKVTGQTVYGIDVRLPGMLRACVVACPVFGGTVASVDDAAARKVSGVKDVLVFDDFVAVVASTWWPAKQACDLLAITWNEGDFADGSSASISEALLAALDDDKAAVTARKHGKALDMLADATVHEAVYEVPYLDHAPIEPLNCTVHLQPDRCEIWVGTQGQTRALKAAQRITGLKAKQITVHTTYLGGGFGRRGNVDWIEQALHVATKVSSPVQLLWSREEMTRHGIYRPAMAARLRASLYGDFITAFHARLTGDNPNHSFVPPIFHGVKTVVVDQRAEGFLHDDPYHYEHVLTDVVPIEFPVPNGYWRSVGHSYTAFMRECFVDELAVRLGTDPLTLRRKLIHKERHKAVLERVAKEADWGSAAEGTFQGIAIAESFGSVCAQVVELTMDGGPRIQKITAVIDCGVVINPDQVKAQVMGGALYGISSALGEQITIEAGRVQQSNFHDYPLLRMNRSPPVVDVHIMDRPDADPGGVGEPGTPPAIAALCNALFAATGTPIRSLPIRLETA